MKKIAFIGATGKLGRPVTDAFLAAGYQLTALARTPEKVQAIWGENIKVIKGDVKNRKDMQRLLHNQEGLYINLSVLPASREKDFQTEREGIQHILAEAQAAGIRRIGYLSSIVQRYEGTHGFHWWVFDLKNQAVAAIKASGIPYFIFYASNFMDNFADGNYRQGKRILLAGKSLHPMYFIAGSDYAKQVVAAFQKDSDLSFEYDMQGPESFTADEAAAVFVKNYEKEKLLITKAPLALLSFLGNFNPTMHYGAHIIKALNNYAEPFTAQRTWEDLGEPKLTLATFARSAR